ncbi:MAG: S8 family serine peptidase [Chloroflexi bacterium]|nr:S8 family serine peptidase [Chloroflexota bacterium]
MINHSRIIKKKDSPAGCKSILVIAVISFWVVGLSFLELFISWMIEQQLFESSMGIKDIRWIVQVIYGVLILIPIILLTNITKSPWQKKIFKLWTLAAVFSMLTVPLKTLYLTAQNETAIFQSGAMLLFLISIKFFRIKNPLPEKTTNGRSYLVGLAAILGLGLSVPWILWGAFGSFLDTLLAITVGSIFAFLIVALLFPHFQDTTRFQEGQGEKNHLILDGFVSAIFLLILVTSLAHNGSQQMLVMTVPFSGWILAALSKASTGKREERMAAVGIISGLLVTLPLAFFDMDELTLSLTGGTGEALPWANRAAIFTLMSLSILTIVSIANSKKIRNIAIPKKWNLGLVIFSVVSVGVCYLLWGQVGFFGDKIFVVLKSQADLSGPAQIQDYGIRKRAVYETLVEHAKLTQKELLEKIDKKQIKFTSYYLLNAIEVDGDMITRSFLADDPMIDRILDSPQLRPLPEEGTLEPGSIRTVSSGSQWNLSMIQSDRVIAELHITGKGIVIGQADSGVDGRHPELANSYRGNNGSDDYNWYDPWNHTVFPTDTGGHGTQTLGVILGNKIGVAPEAQWIACVNLARNLGNPAKYLDCLQFLLAPFPQDGNPSVDGDPTKGAMIINNSWGCSRVEGCDPAIFRPVVKAFQIAGIFMSSSAGNAGYYGCGTISDPIAIYEEVFTAGSVNQNGDLSDFSSLGPVTIDNTGLMKPELVAPGEEIVSAYPGGSYTEGSGTSFSAPHVSGVVALMWSANPNLIGNIKVTFELLKSSVQTYTGKEANCGDTINGVGAGVLDAYRAVQKALLYN